MAADQPERELQRGDLGAAISGRIVALYKEFYGRGPTKAKTYYHGEVITVLLRGGFTKVEETLRAGGRGQEVIEQRMAFQQVMRDRYSQAIEELTGRKVVGFMSGNQQDPDMMCEVFVLESADMAGDEQVPPSSTNHNGPGGQ